MIKWPNGDINRDELFLLLCGVIRAEVKIANQHLMKRNKVADSE